MRWIVGGNAIERDAASTSQMGRFETEWLASDENLAALTGVSGQWIDCVHGRRSLRSIVLDMDSSVSPTHGNQESIAYNGHFACTCYHPLFMFNQFGDLERCALRPGKVHSADGWKDVLEPVVARYRARDLRRYFRADAAFANPEVERVVAFHNKRGTCGQWIKEGKNAIKWTRLSCCSFPANAVRLQLHALAYNLANFMRTLALPEAVAQWSLNSLREKLVKIGAKVVRHARYAIFQMAEVAVPKELSRGCGHDRPHRRTERGGSVVTTGGVRLNDRGEAQIIGSKVVLDIGNDRSAGKTVSANHCFPGTRQNASVRTVSRAYSGHVGLMSVASAPLNRDIRVISVIGVAHGVSHYYQLAFATMLLIVRQEAGLRSTDVGVLGNTSASAYATSLGCHPRSRSAEI